MPFFARPDLSDEQFKQLSGSTLTLEGTTDFTGVLQSKGVEIDATVGSGTTAGDVLQFDGTKIILASSTTGSTGGGIYYGSSPTTCTVGGLVYGTPISGTTIQSILQSILVPALCGTLTAPTRTFSMPVANPYEVGCVLNSLSATLGYNIGSINPQYSSTLPWGTYSVGRSGNPTCYTWTDFNASSGCCGTGALSIPINPFPSYTVEDGNRNAYACVTSSAGAQPSGSTGTPYGTPYSACTTAPQVVSVCGIYPYFYGRLTCSAPAGVGRPSVTCIASIISGGTGLCTKDVEFSNNTICVNFNSTADDYLWFATPCTSTTKTCWYVDATNKGSIGGAVSAGGNLFPAQETVVSGITSSQGCWNQQTYKVYISNYQTCSTAIMELRNS